MSWLGEIEQHIASPDWSQIEATFPRVAEMRACIQDPIHHAEGDVWTHTRAVYEALGRHDLGGDRVAAFAALFHDIAKPQTRSLEYVEKEGREVVRHPDHSRLGAKDAWYHLWIADVDVTTRLEVYWLIAWHQRVFHMFDYKNMDRKAYEYTFLGSWERLVNFARADMAGRIRIGKDDTRGELDLLESYLREELDVWDRSPDWTSNQRVEFFEKPERSPHYVPQDASGSRVVIVSGLPGAGKDTYLAKTFPDLPVVSPDDLREDLGISPTENQGRIRHATLERARVHLRKGGSFAWNSTALTRQMRRGMIGLCRKYDAHVEIHAVDRPLQTILRQNRERSRNVPEKVIHALAAKWEPPSLLEAHDVVWT